MQPLQLKDLIEENHRLKTRNQKLIEEIKVTKEVLEELIEFKTQVEARRNGAESPGEGNRETSSQAGESLYLAQGMQAGVAIVISPLIALMKNQVDQLHAMGVNAAFVNSTLSKKSIKEIRADVLSGKTKLLYVAPESLLKEDNLAFLKQVQISFIVVDEAHCISDWGHDFWPEYIKIKAALDQAFGLLPIIGLTATATPRVQQDILKNLGMSMIIYLHLPLATWHSKQMNERDNHAPAVEETSTSPQMINFLHNSKSCFL